MMYKNSASAPHKNKNELCYGNAVGRSGRGIRQIDLEKQSEIIMTAWATT